MKREQQRIAIATACGWRNTAKAPYQDWRHDSLPSHNTPTGLPDYLNDLNAMHEAVRVLTDAQRSDFRLHLSKVWTRDYNSRCGFYPTHDDSCNATARQRAESFLRTLNLWQP